jgi:hypothetical protein
MEYCKHGHARNALNTYHYVGAGGKAQRSCKICHTARMREYRNKEKRADQLAMERLRAGIP